MDLYEQCGPKWSAIARQIPGRTDDACSKRYREALDPSLKKDQWTPEEDQHLLDAFLRIGGKWGKVGSELQRSGLACRNRFFPPIIMSLPALTIIILIGGVCWNARKHRRANLSLLLSKRYKSMTCLLSMTFLKSKTFIYRPQSTGPLTTPRKHTPHSLTMLKLLVDLSASRRPSSWISQTLRLHPLNFLRHHSVPLFLTLLAPLLLCLLAVYTTRLNSWFKIYSRTMKILSLFPRCRS